MLRRMVRAADPPPLWEADLAVDGRSQSVASSRWPTSRRSNHHVIDASAMNPPPGAYFRAVDPDGARQLAS